jgi:hypothetical protein
MVRRTRPALLDVALGACLAAALLPGCYDLKKVDPGIEVLPDAHGRVDAANNELGIRGFWFAYGDQYDQPHACTAIGMHDPSECSKIDWPPPQLPPALDFPNEDGRMCVYGTAAAVVSCLPTNELPCDSSGNDYSNIWGAGIGLDFNLDVADSDNPARDPLSRRVWNPEEHGVTGIAFDFSLISPASGDTSSTGAPLEGPGGNAYLRVEFPMLLPLGLPLPPDRGTASIGNGTIVPPTCTEGQQTCVEPGNEYPDSPTPSEEHPSGSPFWKAPPTWSNPIPSPVRQGHNEVRFSEVRAPPQETQWPSAAYHFDETQLLGIQFHVPTTTTASVDFGFCISNLVFLRD